MHSLLLQMERQSVEACPDLVHWMIGHGLRMCDSSASPRPENAPTESSSLPHHHHMLLQMRAEKCIHNLLLQIKEQSVEAKYTICFYRLTSNL